MMMPNQNIAENKKDLRWRTDCVRSIIDMVGNTSLAKQKDRFCYDLYNGVFSEQDYDYLRKVDKYEYPAKIRFIPLLRPRIDRLRSQETKRPFKWRVFAADRQSVDKKQDMKVQEMMGMMMSKLMQKNMMIEEMSTAIAEKQEDMQMAAQEAQEDIMQQREIKKMQQRLEAMKQPLSIQALITKEEMENVEIRYRYEVKDHLEELADRGLKYMISEYALLEKFNYGFEDKLVTDNEVYFVHYTPGEPDPRVRKVNWLNFYYSNDDESEWIGNCGETMEERWMTLPQIIDEFGTELSEADMKSLKNTNFNYFTDINRSYQYSNENDYTTDGHGQSNNLYAGSNFYGNMMRVCYCTWKSVRQVPIKRSPNKKLPGQEFSHIIDKDEDFKIRNGERIEYRYMNDVWEGVNINNIFLRMQKMPVQLRSVDRLGDVQNPYVGKAFNGVNKKPYSIIWAAKDIQILYNLVFYHKELWLALSGVKGFIMDKSQLPDGMSMQEWMYQRKIGVGWIQSVKEGLVRQPSFNQFTTYDDTVSASIQYLDGILSHLEDLIGTITGVNRQSLGQMESRDLKGVTEQAIMQQSMVTEIIFYEHDKTKEKVLERLINLTKIAWKKGRKGQFVLGDLGQEMLNVPEDTINTADYRLYVGDGGKQERMLSELKQLSFAEHGKGILNLQQLVKVYTLDSVREIEKHLEKFGEIAEQKMAGAQQSQMQAEQQKLQMEQEYKALADKQKNDILAMGVSLQQAQLEFEKQKFGIDQEFENRKLAQDGEFRQREIDSERTVEMAYLQQQKEENIADIAFRKLELAANVTTEVKKIGAQARSKEKIIDK